MITPIIYCAHEGIEISIIHDILISITTLLVCMMLFSILVFVIYVIHLKYLKRSNKYIKRSIRKLFNKRECIVMSLYALVLSISIILLYFLTLKNDE